MKKAPETGRNLGMGKATEMGKATDMGKATEMGKAKEKGKAPIIDKDGKLFGKVSVIDLIVVALLVAAGLFLATRYLGSKGAAITPGGALDLLEVKFYSEEVNDFVADAISVGDAAKEFAQYASFGTVTAVEVGPSITWVADSNAKMFGQEKDGYKSVTVTMRVRGKLDSTGFSLDGTTYFVGKTVILYLGKAGFQGRISGVEVVQE